MSYTRAEREHIVRISDDQAEPLTFYTHSETWAKRLQAKGAKLKRVSSVEGRETAWTLECPRTWFKLPSPKRKVSDKQRAEAGQRMAELQAARRSQ